MKITMRSKWMTVLLLVVFFGYSGLLQAGEAKPVGVVTFAVGGVELQRAGKAERMQQGAAVMAGDRIRTGNDGYVHLRMQDQGFISIRPSSVLIVQDYSYNPENAADNKVRLQLEKGVVRTISGKAGEAARERYRFNTPVAAIGLRGTDYVVQASAEATRVSVLKGAVIVSPFGQDCSPVAISPCGGSLARELSAGQAHSYIEVRAHGGGAVIMPAGSKEAPDRVSPPHPQEPRAAVSKDAPDTLVSRALDRLTPVVVPQQPEPRPEISWGRWSSVAQIDTPALTGLLVPDREITFGNALFGLLRPTGSVSIPASGTIAMRLAGGEAYVRDNQGGLIAASLGQGTLGLDFNNRQFSTTLAALYPGGGVNLQAQGAITHQGVLYGDPGRSNMNVSGVLTQNVKEAGYLFDAVLPTNETLIGATRWKR